MLAVLRLPRKSTLWLRFWTFLCIAACLAACERRNRTAFDEHEAASLIIECAATHVARGGTLPAERDDLIRVCPSLGELNDVISISVRRDASNQQVWILYTVPPAPEDEQIVISDAQVRIAIDDADWSELVERAARD